MWQCVVGRGREWEKRAKCKTCRSPSGNVIAVIAVHISISIGINYHCSAYLITYPSPPPRRTSPILDNSSINSGTLLNQAYGVSTTNQQNNTYKRIHMGTIGRPPLPTRNYRAVTPEYVDMDPTPRTATTFGHVKAEEEDSDEHYEKLDDVTEAIASNPLYSGSVITNHNAEEDKSESRC